MRKESYSQITNVLLTLFFTLGVISCSCNHKNISGVWDDDDPDRPKVGLVLGGGGAKCAAQIGVLKKLEEMGIKVDCIAGSSMGAVIGSLYAAGYSADSIKQIMLEKKWMKVFDENEFDKKAFALEIANKFDFLNLFKDRDIKGYHHCTGLVSRRIFQEKLDELLRHKNSYVFGRTKIPFYCTTTILEPKKMKPYIFKEGVISNGVTASISHPIYLKAWTHEGKSMYDGGLLDNLPVDTLRKMRPDLDYVIAIDVENENPILNKGVPIDDLAAIITNIVNSLPNAPNIPIDKIINIIEDNVDYAAPIKEWFESRPDVTNREKVKQEAEHDDSLIFIHVDLDYKITSYGRSECESMYYKGYETAEAHYSELKKLLK